MRSISFSMASLNLFPGQLRHDLDRIGFQNIQIVQKLADIEFPLAGLDFCHQRLGAIEKLRYCGLRQSSLLSQGLEFFAQNLPTIGVKGFGQTFFQSARLPQKADYPIFGIIIFVLPRSPLYRWCHAV